MWRSRRTLLVGLLLTGIVVAVLLARVSRATPHVREQVVAALNEQFDGEVALDQFQVDVFPRPAVTGSGVVLRLSTDEDVPPVLQIGRFSAAAGLLGLIRTPVRLRTVELDHLRLYIPRGGGKAESEADGRRAGFQRTHLVVDEIVSHAAELRIASKEPGKLPRVFEIHDLHILGYGRTEAAAFHARLTNPTPEGRVDTHGRFGPWRAEAPRLTPLSGEYAFRDADLNTIKGLGGTLSSTGSYSGVLERIEVAGETETPDFSLDIARRGVPLTTRFTAIVDGTNGNTRLEEVDARLRNSRILARGAVVRTERVDGRHVALDIRIDDGRIEDFLDLAVKGAKAPLVGAVKVKTRFVLPAGDEAVVRKLRLDGDFALDQARFTSVDVQQRIATLSEKGRSDDVPEGESVVSSMAGTFALRDGTLTFSRLTFAVPGAVVELAGAFRLEDETLDFRGHLLLDASLRETTSGLKAVLAAIAQPLFRRKGGGSKIPIRVGGTREKPEFGLDVRRALLPG